MKVRGENAAALREALSACRFLQLPKYRKSVEPGFYVLTTNFLSHKAKVRRDTFLAALKAEGVQAFAYVPEGIQHWRRLQWKGYKVDHAVELSFTHWHKPARRAMQRMADAFLKVEDQIESLREYEAAQDESTGDGTQRTLGEARRAAASYGRGKGR